MKRKIKVSHEVPFCLLNYSREFNDYDYCLPHLLDQNEEYKAYFIQAKAEGRYIVMDNSLHELGEAYNTARLLLWIDEIKPNEEWVSANVEGSSKTGNNPDWANTGKSDVNKKRNKIRKDNLLAKIKRKAYNKSPQPVVSDKSGETTDKVSKIMMKLEKKNILLNLNNSIQFFNTLIIISLVFCSLVT